MADGEELRTLARADGPRGEVVLRRRITVNDAIDELIVNGTFAMDSAETSTELALARTVAGRGAGVPVGDTPSGDAPGRETPVGDVLVGGLGLGFTVAELLRLGARRVDVVEIEACLIDWAEEAITPTLGSVAVDPRVRLHPGDIADVLSAGRLGDLTQWDAVLLDVDNGPDFLIHDANARIYRPGVLRAATERLAPGGVLAIWCQGPAPGLAADLAGLGSRVEEQLIEVERERRVLTYAIYTLRR